MQDVTKQAKDYAQLVSSRAQLVQPLYLQPGLNLTTSGEADHVLN